jgi:hypothetical protein
MALFGIGIGIGIGIEAIPTPIYKAVGPWIVVFYCRII